MRPPRRSKKTDPRPPPKVGRDCRAAEGRPIRGHCQRQAESPRRRRKVDPSLPVGRGGHAAEGRPRRVRRRRYLAEVARPPKEGRPEAAGEGRPSWQRRTKADSKLLPKVGRGRHVARGMPSWRGCSSSLGVCLDSAFWPNPTKRLAFCLAVQIVRCEERGNPLYVSMNQSR